MDSISIFDLIKVGIGPSSSHTMGPWQAAKHFIEYLDEQNLWDNISEVSCTLYGSLAKTGKGHGTDFALTLGLAGYDYITTPSEQLSQAYHQIINDQSIMLGNRLKLRFDSDSIRFDLSASQLEHPNTLSIAVILKDQRLVSKTYHSVGGGFVVEPGLEVQKDVRTASKYPCHDSHTLISYCHKLNMTIAELVRLNESTWYSNDQINQKLDNLWHEMLDSIWRGLHTAGYLPGYLKVKRRASDLFVSLTQGQTFSSHHEWINWLQANPKDFVVVNKWISAFALAVNEENAAFGKIVTAPTNGAAGVIPAVLMYAVAFTPFNTIDHIRDFLLTAGEIGTLFKKSATISAAMGGCQAEIGVSSAMAASGLAQIQGASPAQITMAAEIAMEHHLGLTCDPVGGFVQIPCIERNSMGAIKAITAANIALESDPNQAKVTLDNVIHTMWQTALDMNHKYKETSEAGLATNISVNFVDC